MNSDDRAPGRPAAPPIPPAPGRVRRQPPRFRQVAVHDVAPITPFLRRVVLGGPDLDAMTIDQPAASVRLLLPIPDGGGLVIPTWNGNEFLLADGSRPLLRTFTPRRFDAANLELELQIVIHDQGAASQWAQTAALGDQVGLSGPGRGYVIDTDADAFVLCGDESAIPAISQLLEVLPRQQPVQVVVEITHPEARVGLPEHPRAHIHWAELAAGSPPGDSLVERLLTIDIAANARIWAAGEAASMQRIRRHLFEERGLARTHTTVRGYWKHGRSGGDDTA